MTTENNQILKSNIDDIIGCSESTFTSSMFDVIENRMIENESKSLNERIGDNTVELRNYLKHTGGKGKVSGRALLSNKIYDLAIIDVDINKSYDEDMRVQVRDGILSKLNFLDAPIVKTGSGGLHIYVNSGCFPTTSNRMIKCYQCDDYDIDIFSCVDEFKQSCVVLPGSRVRVNATKPITSYEFIKGSYETVIKSCVDDVLNALDIKVTIEQSGEINDIINDNRDSVITDELAEVIVGGLCDLEVHNDGGNRKLDQEVTFYVLFQAINSLPQQFIDIAYQVVHENCKLTYNARSKFDEARDRYSHLHTSPFVLVKILKLYQPEYFDVHVKPLLTTTNILTHKINLKDSFCLTDIRVKAESKAYKNGVEVLTDLSKVIRFIESTPPMYLVKTFNENSNMYFVSYCTQSSMKETLRTIKLWKDERKNITAYDVMIDSLSKITVKGVRFNSDVDGIFSHFQGYKYDVLDDVNDDVISHFIKLIDEVICDSKPEIFDYVLNWVSFIVQNPGVKSEVALVLKGLQGIGKNRFTDILSELFAGYSAENITEINELTGTFNSVIEAKMLVILNELKNVGDDRIANFNSLKSVITDKTIRINEKNTPRHTAENVGNLIFCTNNCYPVKIENGDRRYVVLMCNGKYKGNFEYFNTLMKACNKEFYDNLLTFFTKRDITAFNVRDIPMTEAKQDIIDLSKTPIDQWIGDHYDELLKGIPCTEALMLKPLDMKDKNFQSQLKDRCIRERRTIDKVRVWHYVLKDECKNLYKQTEVDDYVDDYVNDCVGDCV